MPVESTNLSGAQRTRVDALLAARRVLVAQSVISSGEADAVDLTCVARYIETGEDPYGRGPRKAGDE